MILPLCVMLSTLTTIEPTSADLLSECALRSATLNRLQLSLDVQDTSRSVREGPLLERYNSIDVWFSETGSIIATVEETAPTKGGGATPGEIVSTIKVDGKKSYNFMRSKTGQPVVLITPGNLVRWAIDPRYLLCISDWCPSKKLADTKGIVVEGPTDIGGRRCYGLSWDSSKTTPEPEAFVRGTYWIAPELGHAVVRALIECRPKSAMQWKPTDEIEANDFQRIGDLWLPKNVIYNRHTYYDSDGFYESTKSVVATIRPAATDYASDASRITVDIPDGTFVSDRVRNVSYVKGKIDNTLIESQVAKANALLKERMEQEDADARRSFRLRLAVGLSAAVFGVLFLYIFVRRFH